MGHLRWWLFLLGGFREFALGRHGAEKENEKFRFTDGVVSRTTLKKMNFRFYFSHMNREQFVKSLSAIIDEAGEFHASDRAMLFGFLENIGV